MQKPSRFKPLVRRVLAVDAGSRCLRLMLLERRFGRLRVVKQEAIDLHEEGLVAPEELKAHVQSIVADWGCPPIAFALPEHVAVSQSVDLPPGPESESRKLIEDETIKLGGVSESAIVYDFVGVPSPSENHHRFWVTFCQEGDIHTRFAQLGIEREDFCEVTTAANALLTAWRMMQSRSSNAVLIHAGAQNTIVVVALDGIGVYASSFPMGGDSFTRAISRFRDVPVERAEALKRSENLLEGSGQLTGLTEMVDGWATELKRQLNDWREHQRGKTKLSGLELLASGGVFDQPGLLDYLNTRAGLKLKRWPTDRAVGALLPTTGFEIALGTALQALGYSAQPISLLPADRQVAWQQRLGRQRFELASWFLLVFVLLALIFGVWQKVSLIHHKEALLAKVQAGIESAKENATFTAELLAEFDTLRPLFESQQNTSDTLHTLDQLQQSRAHQAFWYVLLADQQSYFSQPPTAATTAATTNKPAASPNLAGLGSVTVTNTSPAKPGCIAELCIPGDPDAGRQVLSAVVNGLKKDPAFVSVDLLSEDLHRSLADPKVVLPDRHFTLAFDFATTEFQSPIAPRKTGSSGLTRATQRPNPGTDAPNNATQSP
jgi:Tfp pilus assembly PilM family ATPase